MIGSCPTCQEHCDLTYACRAVTHPSPRMPKSCLSNLLHKLSHGVLFGLCGFVPCVHVYVYIFVLMGDRGQAHV